MNQVRKTSLILALSTTFLFTSIILYFLNFKSESHQGNTAGEKLSTVVIAISDIEANSLLKENDFKEINIPEKYVISGSIEAIKDIVGKTSKENIYAGEQILHNNIYKVDDWDRLSIILPEGYRAITLKVDAVNGIAGNIKKGDFIDLLVLLKPPYKTNETVKTAFQNIDVIEFKGLGDSYLLTVYMKPEDINKLFLYEEIGNIKIILRQVSDRAVNSEFIVDTTILK